MKITNRLFTYPILSDEKSDYQTSQFNVTYTHTPDGPNSIKLEFDISTDCEEIENLIVQGYAEYVIHLECSTTAYREVIRSISKHIEHTVSIERINGSFDAVAFITLKKDISKFSCKDWVDAYDGIDFNLKAGHILAYQNLPNLNITKNFEEFNNSSSIFSIYSKANANDKGADVILESSKIRIGLASDDYKIFVTYSQNTSLQAVLNTMLVLPALVYVFEELKQENNEELYSQREWFMSLEKAYSKRGLDFMQELNGSNKTSFQLAQEAMEFPLSKALIQIPELYDLLEEEL